MCQPRHARVAPRTLFSVANSSLPDLLETSLYTYTGTSSCQRAQSLGNFINQSRWCVWSNRDADVSSIATEYRRTWYMYPTETGVKLSRC